MKLDTRAFRYLSPEDWRVLTAVEQGTKNHEIVPTQLIASLAHLHTGSNGANRSISTLAKAGLIAKVKNAKYDGYRLTYGGLDYLALHAHTKSSAILSLGSQMGVGKESDIYLITSPSPSSSLSGGMDLTPSTNPDTSTTTTTTPSTPNAAATPLSRPIQSILKIHRLGRTSFRSLARNRDYLRNRQNASWQYLSRLSAQKEFAAMSALHHAGFPVPGPIAWNRHTIVMSLVPGMPLRQVDAAAFGQGKRGREEGIAALYRGIMELALELAEVGCIHGDFNEFNILIENVPEGAEDDVGEQSEIPEPSAPLKQSQETQTEKKKPLTPHLIDFPQITSLSHPQARSYFDRDITCIKTFFQKKYNFESEDPGPTYDDAVKRLQAAERKRARETDVGGRLEVDKASIVTGRTTKRIGSSRRLDVQIEAAGFSRKMARELEDYYEREREDGAEGGDEEEEDFDASRDLDADEAMLSTDETESDDSPNPINQNVVLEADVNGGLPEHWEYPDARVPGKHVDGAVTSKLAALSTTSRQPRQPRPKAVAGWSI